MTKIGVREEEMDFMRLALNKLKFQVGNVDMSGLKKKKSFNMLRVWTEWPIEKKNIGREPRPESHRNLALMANLWWRRMGSNGTWRVARELEVKLEESKWSEGFK